MAADRNESSIMKDIQLKWSKNGWRLWRNNVALGWAGEPKRLKNGDILLSNPRPLHSGLCVGSSDLIGFIPTVIKPEHLGKTLAIFAAIECKSKSGRLTEQQKFFLDMVTKSGGHARCARGYEDSL